MSINLQSALNLIINLQGRNVELLDISDESTYNVKMAPSNYFRNFAAMEDMVIEGREYVFSSSNNIEPKRGWQITDAEMGSSSITEVKEMIALGKIIGYRLRTN